MACKRRCSGGNSSNFSQEAKHKIQIQLRTLTHDSYGGQEITWSNAHNVWAIIHPRAGRELIINGALDSTVNTVFIIRYIAGLKNTQDAAQYRIQFDDREYNIVAINNVESFKGRNHREGTKYQVIYAVEGANS